MANHHLEGTPDALLDQACQTPASSLIQGIFVIDRELGEGYAHSNPDLLAAYILAGSDAFNTAISSQQTRAGMEAIAAGLVRIAESFETVAEAIEHIEIPGLHLDAVADTIAMSIEEHARVMTFGKDHPHG